MIVLASLQVVAQIALGLAFLHQLSRPSRNPSASVPHVSSTV